MSGVLETYAGAVAARTQKAGWIEVVLPVVLPVVVELITKCFDKSSELKSFAEGQRSALQLAGLRIRCNRAAREAGIDGFRRVQKAGTALMQAVLDELDDRADLLAGTESNAYDDAMAEALAVA